MKALKELQQTSLVELLTNAEEWKIKTKRDWNDRSKIIVYRDLYFGKLPEHIYTCNVLKYAWAKLRVWVRGQRRCKVWAMASGIVTGFSLAAIVMMTSAGVDLMGQLWAVILFVISGFILTISSAKL